MSMATAVPRARPHISRVQLWSSGPVLSLRSSRGVSSSVTGVPCGQPNSASVPGPPRSSTRVELARAGLFIPATGYGMLWNQSVSEGSSPLDGGGLLDGGGPAAGAGEAAATYRSTGADSMGEAEAPGRSSGARKRSSGARSMARCPRSVTGARSMAACGMLPAGALCSVHCVPSHQRSRSAASTGSSYQPGGGISMQAPTPMSHCGPAGQARTSTTSRRPVSSPESPQGQAAYRMSSGERWQSGQMRACGPSRPTGRRPVKPRDRMRQAAAGGRAARSRR